MTAKEFMMTDTAINNIFAAESEIANLKGQNSANTKLANEKKISQYAEIVAEISQVKLVKGNLPRTVSKKVKEALVEEAGVKAATCKRLMEGSVGVVRLIKEKIGDIPSQYTPSAVISDLAALEIDSEAKLHKAIKGEADKSKPERYVDMVVGKFSTKKDDNGKVIQGDVFKDGLDDEELDEFINLMRERQAARKAYRDTVAAKAAEADAAAENDTVDQAVVAMLDELGVAS
jgi:hypothetical protein